MKRIFILVVIVSILVGGGIGYAIGYMVYMPTIASHVNKINNLTSEVSNLVQINNGLGKTLDMKDDFIINQAIEINKLEEESTNQETMIVNLQDHISTLEIQNAELANDLNEIQGELDETEYKLQDKTIELTSLRNRYNEILDISVTQHYEWTSSGSWSWDISIPLSSYVEYYDRPRSHYASQFVDMILESQHDPCIINLVNEFSEMATRNRLTERQIVNNVATFVQSMPYTIDYETKGYDEYPRYPVETLFDRGGDCEDSSILVATLLDNLGVNVVLLHLENKQHMAVGVDTSVSYGYYYEYQGVKYWYLETTAEGWQLGQIPPEMRDARAYVYPLGL